jgi:hypothetical protein
MYGPGGNLAAWVRRAGMMVCVCVGVADVVDVVDVVGVVDVVICLASFRDDDGTMATRCQ